MRIDLPREIGATTREVRDCTRDGKPARMVVAMRTYDTTPEDVWDAITQAERIPRWFLPISGDLRLGGRYQLKGNAGGEITRCDPPRHLAVTWEFNGEVSWVDVQLHEDPKGGTRLELQHMALLGGAGDEFWDKYGAGATGVGWDLTLLGLNRYLVSGGSMSHEEAEAWAQSSEGKDFSRASSEQWCRASIAYGTDIEAAKAAAARTTAFYTGEDAPAETRA